MFQKKDSDIIRHDDLVEEGALSDHIHLEIERLMKIMSVAETKILQNAKNISDGLKGISLGTSSTLADLKKINETVKQATEVEAAHSKVQKTKIELTNQQLAQQKIDKEAKRDSINLLKAEIIELSKTAGTLQKVEAANTKLRLERKNLNTQTEEGKKRLAQLNAEIDKNNKYIVENSDKLKQQKLNVGNYTQSIREALQGTGIFGETINKYLSTVEMFAAKIEAVVIAMTSQKVATEATTIATEAATVAENANTATLQKQAAAAEASAVANTGLGNALKALATNPYVLAAAGIAALTKVLYDNVTATDANRDKIKSLVEGFKAYISTIDVAGVNSLAYAGAAAGLSEELEKIQDAQIDLIVSTQKLRTEAALSRQDAVEEGKTTKQRIEALDNYIKKSSQAADQEIALAKRVASARQAFKAVAIAAGKDLSDEQRREIQEAQALVNQLIADQATETIRAQKQRTTLIEKYREELKKLNQEAELAELDAIDSFSEDRRKQIQKQLDKDSKQSRLATDQAIENKRKQQAELGAIDIDGIDHTAEFERQLEAERKKGRAKERELNRKAKEELRKLDEEDEKKRIDLIIKQSEANAKQADKDFKITSAKLAEQQSAELLLIEEGYAKKKDFSVKAEEERQKAILDVKIKYLELELKRNEDNEEEKARIQKQINDLKADFARGLAANEKKSDEERKKAALERLKQIKKVEDQITEGIRQGLQTRSEIQQQAAQRDIDFHTRMLDVQAKLAAEGKDNTLAEELAAATQAEEKKLQAAKRAARQQENIALIKTFSDVLTAELEKEPKGNFLKAFAKALAAVGASEAVFAKLFAGGFAEGVENLHGKGTETSDSNIALLSKGESVTTARGTKETPGLVTAVNEKGYEGAVDWAFENIYLPQFKSTNVSTTHIKESNQIPAMTSVLSQKIDRLTAVVESKPVSQSNLRGLGEWTDEILSKGVKTVIHHKKNSTRPSLRLNG